MTDAEKDVLTLYLSKDITTLYSPQLVRFAYLLEQAAAALQTEEKRRAK